MSMTMTMTMALHRLTNCCGRSVLHSCNVFIPLCPPSCCRHVTESVVFNPKLHLARFISPTPVFTTKPISHSTPAPRNKVSKRANQTKVLLAWKTTQFHLETTGTSIIGQQNWFASAGSLMI